MDHQVTEQQQDLGEVRNQYPVKAYGMLGLWFLVFFVCGGIFSIAASRWGEELGVKLITLLWLNLVNLLLAGLFYMILKTQRVYYINYVSYKEAVAATEEERIRFAGQHLKTFLKATGLFAIYTAVSLWFKVGLVLDVGIYMLILIAAALGTIPFKLGK